MDRTRRIAAFSAALIIAVVTMVMIGLSVDAIRDSVQFSRVMRRIERGDNATSTLLEAGQFARTTSEWQTLMRVAWDLDPPRLWEAVFALAQPAMRRFPEDNRWRYAGALAALRQHDRSEARTLLPLDQGAPADDLEQLLRVLVEIEPDHWERSRDRLSAFLELPSEYTVLRAIAEAETNPSLETYRDAWKLTSVGAYGVNAALEGAAVGDREGVRSLLTHIREAETLPPAERVSAPLYLAVWLQDIDWLFQQLRSLSGARAVEPEVLLLHAEGLIQQGRRQQARRFYRELQQVAPEYDPLAFLNDAAITFQERDGEPAEILREGVRVHPDSAVLRGELAGILTAQDERIAAAQVLGPSLLEHSSGEQRHRDWLLTRAVLGPRRPLSRLESDLWLYLNDNPDADLVARYLARFLAARGDETGMDRLRERYAPGYSEWSTTLHMQHARRTGNYSQAESLMALYPDDSWTARYNRVLFALYHLSLPEVSDSIDELQAWLGRGPDLSQDTYSRAEIDLLLVRVEQQRLAGDAEAALETLNQARRIAPDDLNLASYERLVAPPQ
ncbi:MAG: hypothetical protein WD492_01565 [Alkalispirochaeta sp.]